VALAGHRFAHVPKDSSWAVAVKLGDSVPMGGGLRIKSSRVEPPTAPLTRPMRLMR